MALTPALLSSALLLANPALPAVPAPHRVSLDELKAEPQRYAGQVVDLSGQLDECWNYSCHLCPLEATPAKPQWERCLAIDFDRFRGGDGNRGADMDGAFRYADVSLTARFDPTCLEEICTDRASVLLDARVERVDRRRPSNEGLMRRPDPLLLIAAADAEPIARLIRSPATEERVRPVRIFATRSDPLASHEAVACMSWSRGNAPIAWPSSFEGAIPERSTEDRYKCWIARKSGGGWALEPN
jgi:hypothetical protein